MASSSLSIANEFSSVRILNAGEEAEGNVNAEQQVDADETIIRRHDFLKERIWFGNVIVFLHLQEVFGPHFLVCKYVNHLLSHQYAWLDSGHGHHTKWYTKVPK